MLFSFRLQALSLLEVVKLPSLNQPAKHLAKTLESNKGEDDLPFAFITLSFTCPCSVSHIDYLSQLSERYRNKIYLVGLLADPYATDEDVQSFLSDHQLPLPIFHDVDLTLSRKLMAITTPHAFFYKQENLIYQGAVSSSHTFTTKNELYLEDSFEKSMNDKDYMAQTKPLGCMISYP